MPDLYEVRVTATGEVRDAAGNLVSSAPVEMTLTLTEAELSALVDREILDSKGEE